MSVPAQRRIPHTNQPGTPSYALLDAAYTYALAHHAAYHQAHDGTDHEWATARLACDYALGDLVQAALRLPGTQPTDNQLTGVTARMRDRLVAWRRGMV